MFPYSMNSLLASHFPSLLLFGFGDVVRVAGLLFVVVFCAVFFLLARRYGLFKKEGGEKSGSFARTRFFGALAVFTLVFCVLGAVMSLHRSNAANARDGEGYVLVGDAQDAAAEGGESGEVLGETTTAGDSLAPKSQNYRLGFLSVGGDNRAYLANAEDKKLAVSSVGYKTVIDENRENTGAIIKWKTNKPSRGEILYRKNSDTEFRSIKESSFGWEHTIVLEKLGYASTYVFLINAKDRWGNETKSENYALYSGSNSPSLFDLLASAFGDMFGWAMKK